MNGESGPKAAPEITASQRTIHTHSTCTARQQLAKARADALALDMIATAGGVLEPTPQMLDALAELAASLAFDLWTVAA
jgi:hypothetical protein